MLPKLEELPERVCWTRMQAEAGEQLARIIRRKDIERRIGNGLFFWGVGSAPSRAIPSLVRSEAAIAVVFSVMKSKPKAMDTTPSRVLAWRKYVGSDGVPRPLPEHVMVTSRAGSRQCHYALMCRSDSALAIADHGSFDPAAFRNVGAGGSVGASQVTALLERRAPDGASDYRVAMRATLTESLWVKLIEPVELTGAARAALAEEPADEDSWLDLVDYVRSRCRAAPTSVSAQASLFSI